MPSYVILVNFTDQGIRAVKETVARARAAQELAERMGGKLTAHWTLGVYDLVAFSEWPDEQTAVAFALATGSQGNIRTTMLRAYAEDEMAGIIGKLG